MSSNTKYSTINTTQILGEKYNERSGGRNGGGDDEECESTAGYKPCDGGGDDECESTAG
jgi:hypothetical protein